ncbi:MAG: hypothetical protein A4E30_00598 [Methanomassiliicoccales archaeon PtaB.Bin215]|nr:MAG: hypothetical protein A4E30_00598 [Methanomassiliicoccales archaeon PtaB.Bin215]
MRREWLWALAAALLLSSAALGWMAWERGEVELYLFLIFPVLKADGAFGAASLLLAFAAVVVIFLSFFIPVPKGSTGPPERPSMGGVVLIGPIPIVLGSDRRTALLALVVGLAALIIMLLFFQ